ncbi:6752_t:CDS:10, partial [Funneliformis geosporum]
MNSFKIPYNQIENKIRQFKEGADYRLTEEKYHAPDVNLKGYTTREYQINSPQLQKIVQEYLNQQTAIFMQFDSKNGVLNYGYYTRPQEGEVCRLFITYGDRTQKKEGFNQYYQAAKKSWEQKDEDIAAGRYKVETSRYGLTSQEKRLSFYKTFEHVKGVCKPLEYDCALRNNYRYHTQEQKELIASHKQIIAEIKARLGVLEKTGEYHNCGIKKCCSAHDKPDHSKPINDNKGLIEAAPGIVEISIDPSNRDNLLIKYANGKVNNLEIASDLPQDSGSRNLDLSASTTKKRIMGKTFKLARKSSQSSPRGTVVARPPSKRKVGSSNLPAGNYLSSPKIPPRKVAGGVDANNLELILNSLKEIKLCGLARIKGSPLAVIRESKISNFIDLITQNGQGISPETKLKILTSANLEGLNDLELARQKLDQKHYNLEEVKKEIIEYLSIRKRILTTPQESKESFGEVICLEGPPGVGKTSLASTIAEAMGRKFISISLNGVYDAAEILGHRITYTGSKPGRIIQAMRDVQVINPVFLIDEIDKISPHHSNPAHALLRVLDPEFNKKFIDAYLGENVPYNLSEAMFICTANNTYDLPRPLRNRMKIICIPPYTDLEKAEIAKNFLIPKYLKRYNFSTSEINFQEAAIRKIISDYTTKRGGEGGVRELSRQIDTVFRKFSVKLEKNPSLRVEISPSNLHEFLNKRDYEPFHPQIYSRPGVVNGLAYSGYSGDVLQIEVAFYEKKGGGLEITGNLGKVMEESIKVAVSYIKSNYQELGVNPELFSQHTIHINTIEGAVPKEGPSAGIAITSPIISALTKRVIPSDLGMTGTISLHGQVGEVGAVKAKVIGGYNKGLKRFIIPKTNQKDLENIPAEAKIFPVENYQEVLKIIFAAEPKPTKKRTRNTLHLEKKRRIEKTKKGNLIKTYHRELPVVPEMFGHTIGIHNGRTF